MDRSADTLRVDTLELPTADPDTSGVDSFGDALSGDRLAPQTSAPETQALKASERRGSWQPYLPKGPNLLGGMLSAIRFIPMRHSDGRRGFIYERNATSLDMVERLKKQHSAVGDHVRFASRSRIIMLWSKLLSNGLSDFARNHLASTQPHMSARYTFRPAQGFVLMALVAAMVAWANYDGASFAIALNMMFAFFFLSVAMARVLAAITPPIEKRDAEQNRARLPDDSLPPYSVLVPIYDEAAMVPHLLRALTALDYPTDKLDIFILAEADDAATLGALAAHTLPDHIAVLQVPPSKPRTKPKALNYALPLTRGTYLTIYDAEDRPEPDQLRKAVAAFSQPQHGWAKPLGCVQASLNITNGPQSFFTRHFALEYMALFDVFLPALSQLNLPIPLGGTSNHFLRSALIDAGGWDPYNVTEDADLGIRLARMGYTTQMIASTTYEQAPAKHKPWLRQRSRWFKGWWQTWLVHMRSPLRLLDDLGWPGFVALQTVLLGVLLSVLLHPFFLAVSLWTILDIFAQGLVQTAQAASPTLLMINAVTFIFGYAAAAAMSIVGAERRGVKGIGLVLATIPIYWLCLSVAGLLALWELIVRPHHWHKTPHEAENSQTHRAGNTQRARRARRARHAQRA